jgi:acyl carrier protein
MDPEALVRQLHMHHITRIVVVPSQLAAILEACPNAENRLPDLQLCFSSGEALPYSIYARFQKTLPTARLVNLYGSSEVAADVTCFDTASTPPRGFVPIGKPIANVRTYLLDPSLNPVPVGVPGEIYVAGDCLARGYLGRPELTAERFIPDPFRADGLLYKTGDVARYLEDGNIEFLGRYDHQVKIRGLRIELGEIEAALRTHRSVRAAAVVVRQGEEAAPMLVAYVAPNGGEPLVYSELSRYLKLSLPDYMVPAAFVPVDALPMTPNGKLDQRALPSFDPAQRHTTQVQVAPRNELERKLLEIWVEVLKTERIGVFDNFFELGGHSLMAAQVIARIRKYMGIEVSVRTLFEGPTVASLANALERAPVNDPGAAHPLRPERSIPLSHEQLEARLSELSPEEIDALLARALANRGKRHSTSVGTEGI